MDFLYLFLLKIHNNAFTAHRRVDFGMLAVLLLQLLQSLLLSLPLLLIQALQIFPPLVFFQHLIALELLVPLSIVVLQVLGGLGDEPQGVRSQAVIKQVQTVFYSVLEKTTEI